MKHIINSIKVLETTNPTVYLGDRDFCKLDLKTNESLSRKALNSCGIHLPKDYKTFLLAYNGFQCLEGACELFDLDTAIQSTRWFTEADSPLYNDTLLEIASVVGDYVFIDVTSHKGDIYISREGIVEPTHFNATFKEFLNAILSSNAFKFWDYNPI